MGCLDTNPCMGLNGSGFAPPSAHYQVVDFCSGGVGFCSLRLQALSSQLFLHSVLAGWPHRNTSTAVCR